MLQITTGSWLTEPEQKVSVVKDQQVKSLHEGGYDWVYIPDKLWYKKELRTYINGMDIT